MTGPFGREAVRRVTVIDMGIEVKSWVDFRKRATHAVHPPMLYTTFV